MKSRWIKLCSILLVLTMLINMLPVHALALDSEDRGSASAQGDTESHTVQIIGEVEGLREEGIKHFRLSDGSFVAVSYGLPVHFQNSGGQWIDIDNRLSLAAGAYRTAKVYAQGKLCGNENRKASYADKAETVLQMGNPI